MDFDFNINTIFPETITLINWENSLKSQRKLNGVYKHLQFVIDCLGKRSAKAQQLTGSITSLQKSELNGHHIYVLKEADSNNGLGSVTGFIKVGRKRLFVLDRDGNHNEMYPLCVLDFYVHESQQRKGCGLRLFKHMLSKENVQAQHLAIDRPSHKFICFLKKHFNLWATILQVNNFVVFDGFFKNRTDYAQSKNRRQGSNSSYCRPLSRAVSDDVIKRTRNIDSTSFESNLKDIRPASGTEIAQNDFNSFRIRRKKWNLDGTAFIAKPPTRPNLFSRYMHDAQERINARPPIPSQHRVQKYNMDKVITNQNHCMDIIGDAEKTNGDANSQSNQVAKLQTYVSSDLLSKAKVGNTRTQEVNPENTCLPAVNNHLSEVPHRLYSKPSDMISELKSKDEQFLSNTSNNLPYVYKGWTQRQLKGIGSSWNVLGVPSRPFWSNQ